MQYNHKIAYQLGASVTTLFYSTLNIRYLSTCETSMYDCKILQKALGGSFITAVIHLVHNFLQNSPFINSLTNNSFSQNFVVGAISLNNVIFLSTLTLLGISTFIGPITGLDLDSAPTTFLAISLFISVPIIKSNLINGLSTSGQEAQAEHLERLIFNQHFAFQTGTTLLYLAYSNAINYLYASCANIDYIKHPLGEVCLTEILFTLIGSYGLTDSTAMILDNQFSLSSQNNSFFQNLLNGASTNATSILKNTLRIGCLWSFMKMTDVFNPAAIFFTCLVTCPFINYYYKINNDEPPAPAREELSR